MIKTKFQGQREFLENLGWIRIEDEWVHSKTKFFKKAGYNMRLSTREAILFEAGIELGKKLMTSKLN